jgi:hypothetical protein
MSVPTTPPEFWWGRQSCLQPPIKAAKTGQLRAATTLPETKEYSPPSQIVAELQV